MKTELEQHDIEAIAQRVIELLKPMLSGNGKTGNDDTIFDVQELADYLKVDTSWVYKKVSLKEIPHFHAGKYPRFKKPVIDKWIETQTVRPIPPLKLAR